MDSSARVSAVLLEADIENSSEATEQYHDDGVASIEGKSLTDSRGVTQSESSTTTDLKIATSETKAVVRSKAVVYFVLVLFAVITSVCVGWYVRNEENRDFERTFKSFAKEVSDGSNAKAVTIFGQMNTLATSLTSGALDKTLEWPNVTLPHFDARSEEIGVLSGSSLIMFAPIVDPSKKETWESFVAEYQEIISIDTFGTSEMDGAFSKQVMPIQPKAYEGTNLTLLPQDLLLPVLQYGPKATNSDLINIDLKSHPIIQRVVGDSIDVSHPLLSEVGDFSFLHGSTETTKASINSPQSLIVEPVYNDFEEPRTIVGFVVAAEPWYAYLEGHLPNDVHGILVNVVDTCGGDMTFVLNGDMVEFLGFGELQGLKYESLGQRTEFASFARYDGRFDGARHCNFSLVIYPNNSFQATFHSEDPYLFSCLVFAMFLFTMSVFAAYDWTVAQRQKKVMRAATRTTKIVKSLFPKDVGERLMADVEIKQQDKIKKGNWVTAGSDIHGRTQAEEKFRSEPIAEFYTDTTIMFADIVGFTAWSSTREPKQVFSLLETIYSAFDEIAGRRRVFKVETVGDCYLAVAGLPEPRADHALVMARFARDCMIRFQVLTHKLEVELGPDTSSLGIRVGLHSGPVTAGVLRGDRARFQLFGDTVNTASRMESTGHANKIQISQETAEKLILGGKKHWVRQREEMVSVKGKGKLQTYWVYIKGEGNRSNASRGSSDNTKTMVADTAEHHEPEEIMADTEGRLIQWIVEILSKSLREIAATRMARKEETSEVLQETELLQLERHVLNHGRSAINEINDIGILLVPQTCKNPPLEVTEDLDSDVKRQLNKYVLEIARLYNKNPFHSFEHASHVTLSVVKLLARIVDLSSSDSTTATTAGHTKLDESYMIYADPLTRFACAFSAMIHDVDHQGVSNETLIREASPIAAAYNNKAVAEQHSVNLAWSLLMQSEYTALRRAIYTTESEFKRFRHLICRSVVATDIFDKDLGKQRKERWEKVFSDPVLEYGETAKHEVERKAIIVIEHLIQASDVAHTMQHFQIYKKWNELLFHEMMKAYKQGRSASDPSQFWYENELSFFENYVIPLARKLKECGVFGVASDEYLVYALNNKREWEIRGQQLVEEFKEAANQT